MKQPDMTKKNLSMPHDVFALFRELIDGVGGKNHYLVLSAAVLMYAAQSPESRAAIESSVWLARRAGTLKELVQQAKDGRLFGADKGYAGSVAHVGKANPRRRRSSAKPTDRQRPASNSH